jgi:hypothetical protein
MLPLALAIVFDQRVSSSWSAAPSNETSTNIGGRFPGYNPPGGSGFGEGESVVAVGAADVVGVGAPEVVEPPKLAVVDGEVFVVDRPPIFCTATTAVSKARATKPTRRGDTRRRGSFGKA